MTASYVMYHAVGMALSEKTRTSGQSGPRTKASIYMGNSFTPTVALQDVWILLSILSDQHLFISSIVTSFFTSMKSLGGH